MKSIDIFPELNDKQLDRFSEFLANFSLLVIASLIFPNILGNAKADISELLSGIILVILCLGASMIILRREYD